jgi:hypothetical protein
VTFDYPFRLRVQRALTESLEVIAIDDGYKHDLDGRVFRGRLMFGDTDPLPMVSIVEPALPEELRDPLVASAYELGEWPLVLQGWAQDDFANPTDPAHVLLADVKQRLVFERRRAEGEDILGMGGLVTGLKIGQGVVRPPDTTSDKAYFWCSISLGLVEDLALPYE